MEAVSKTIGIRGTNTAGGGVIQESTEWAGKPHSFPTWSWEFRQGENPTSSPPTACVKNGEEKGSHVVNQPQTQQQKAVIS